jgi:putative glycosyltransferase (TIGR04372 family)
MKAVSDIFIDTLKRLFLKILRLTKIKIGFINANSLGHLAFELDIASILGKVNKKTIWCYTSPVSNTKLFELMLNKALIPGRILNPLLCRTWVPATRGTSSDSNTTATAFTSYLQDLHPAQFQIPDAWIEGTIAELSSFNFKIDRPYVCLSLRDGGYDEFWRSDSRTNGTLYRNCAPEKHTSLVETLIKQGFQVVRMGKNSLPMGYIHPMFFDYSTSGWQNDQNDLVLYQHCSFAISNQTGVDELATIFRKNTYLIDYAPVFGARLTSLRPICLPKLYFKNGVLMSFSRMNAYDFLNDVASDTLLSENNITLHCADEESQKGFVKDCINHYQGLPKTLRIQDGLQLKFEAFFKSHRDFVLGLEHPYSIS